MRTFLLCLNVIDMSYCLICFADLEPFFDLGIHPSANSLLEEHELSQDEYTYPLSVGFCHKCNNVQTLTRPNKEHMFKETYSYFTSANKPMVEHFADTAQVIKQRYKPDTDEDFFIVEMGSNDGVFLQHFKDGHHLGIEPSSNVAFSARRKGINCWTNFFDFSTANDIVDDHGEADVIFAANVFAHVEDVNSIVNGIKILLKPDGVFVFEIYYLPQMVKLTSFDLIYDEHIYYYSLSSLESLFDRYNLEMFDIEHLSVHGGSIRGYVSHAGRYKKTQSYLETYEKEKAEGFGTIEPLQGFAQRADKIKKDLRELFKSIKAEGKMVVGYGATAKSTTILNYCDLTKDDIDYIVDSTPYKQHKYTPGHHIKIVPESEFESLNADYTILFAWNYAEAIMNKQKVYTERGGKWIVMHPDVRVV